LQKLQPLQRSPDDSLDLLRVALNLVRVDGEAAETQVRDVAEVKEIIKAEFFGSLNVIHIRGAASTIPAANAANLSPRAAESKHSDISFRIL